jgi:hypothetical protein
MIKKFFEFFESISGTELFGPIGPNYGDTTLPNKPNSKYTDVIYSEIFGKLVTQDQYQELYQEYLKKGSKPLHGFNLQNLEIVLSKINESINNEDILEYFLELSDLGARVEFDEDFDGKGTPCLEIELIGGWDPYKNHDSYEFILDIHKISVDLLNYNQILMNKGPHGRKRLNSIPMSSKIDLSKISNYTKNQFKRLEDLESLVVSDITYMYSDYNDHNYPMFRIKFKK